jgi:hypothetical protein
MNVGSLGWTTQQFYFLIFIIFLLILQFLFGNKNSKYINFMIIFIYYRCLKNHSPFTIFSFIYLFSVDFRKKPLLNIKQPWLYSRGSWDTPLGRWKFIFLIIILGYFFCTQLIHFDFIQFMAKTLSKMDLLECQRMIRSLKRGTK